MAGSDEHSGRTWSPDGGVAPDGEGIPKGPRYVDAVEIGQGSMGRVLGVTDIHLGRRVAYKELLRRSTSPVARVRFLREARITARLQHPGIAPIYDLGTDDNGIPWYTMRFVEGQTLRDALTEARDVPARMALLPRFVDTCQAVAYAHDRGVVHRDLKPENILIGAFGETLVVDWGLAKGADDEELPALGDTVDSFYSSDSGTIAGTVLGTPNWMSPEQARGEVHDLDARSDVWSLGVILFEILTGTRPFQGRTAEETLAKVRLGLAPSVPELEPRAPTELVAVCARALRPDRALRYPTAGALAQDVEAFLTGGWVRAYRYSAWERAARWLVRYRLLVGTALLSTLALAILGAVSYRQVRDERDHAQAAEATGRRHLAEAFAGKAESALGVGDLLQAELFAAAALDLDERPDARGVLARTRATWRPRRGAAFGPEAGCRHVDAGSGDRAVCAGPAGVSVWSLEAPAQLLLEVPGDAMSAALSPDGARIAIQTTERFSLIDARDGHLQFECPAVRRGANPHPVWHPDSDRLAFAAATGARVLSADGTELGAVHFGSSVVGLSWSEDGLVVADLAGRVQRLAGASPTAEARTDALVDNGLYSIAATEHLAAVGTGSDGILLLNAADLVETRRITGHDGPVMGLAISPDGRWIASAGEDRTLRLVAVATGEQAFTLALPSGSGASLAFVDDNRLLVGSPGTRGQLWILPRERRATRLTDGVSGLTSVSWHPDGFHLATANGTGDAILWDRRSDAPAIHRVAVATEPVRDVVFGDAETVVTTNMAGKVQTWDLEGRRGRLLHEGAVVLMLARDASRQQLYGPSWDGQILRWDGWTDPVESFTGDPEQPMWEVAVSADGTTLAWGDGEDEVTVVSLPDRRPILHQRLKRSPRAIALSPSGDALAWVTDHDVIEIRSLPAGGLVHQLTGPESTVDDLEYSPDGRLLVASSWDQRAWVYDIERGSVVAILADHAHRVVDADFSADGRWLATASWDQTALIWDLAALTEDPREILDQLRVEQGVQLEGARMVATPSDP